MTAKFGSVEWQNEMMRTIEKKLINKEELDGFEKTFLEVQKEHNARLR